MSTNLQTLLRDSLLNNTHDYSVIHETLNNTWVNSYSYLYQLQKSYIEYEEHRYLSGEQYSRDTSDIGHLYVNKLLKACFDINYNFIHVSNREEFKRSKFFKNPFTINDMINNPKIFTKIPIIIIDGQTIWDYTLKTNHEIFTCILPFDSTFVLSNERNSDDDLIYLEHDIQVFIVDNTLYTRLELNKTSVSIPNGKRNMTIPLSHIDSTLLDRTTSKEGIYFASVHLPNKFKEEYELGTILMPCTISNNTLICQLNQDDYDRISKHTYNFFVSVVFVNQLHLHSFYTGNTYTTCVNNECNLFILQRDNNVPYSMPIPVENLMVIRKRNDTLTYVKNTDVVKLYYPNIYEIIDSDKRDGDIYYIYYFYKYAKYLKYTPMFDFYCDFLKIHFKNDSLEQIVDELYHDKMDYSDFDDEQRREFIATCLKLLNREYYKYQYGDIDFINRYLLEDGNTDKDPIEYKDETLRKWINEDPEILRNYVLKQNRLHDSIYHLWTKNIDLDKRFRKSTYPELGDDHGYNLTQECYVFSFRNDDTTSGKVLDARIFVDGLLVTGMVQVRHFFTDYFYIPAKLINTFLYDDESGYKYYDNGDKTYHVKNADGEIVSENIGEDELPNTVELKSDSYIEIEIFPSYDYADMINFVSLDDSHEIQLLEPANNIYPTAQDVYYIAPRGHMVESLTDPRISRSVSTNDENIVNITSKSSASLVVDGVTYQETEIFDPSLFELTAIYNNIEYPIKTTDPNKPVVFTRLNRFKVKPLSENMLNRNIIFCISKNPSGFEIEVQKNIFPYISLVGMSFNYNLDYIRIFRNGRLLPKTKYQFTFTHSFPRIVFTDAVDIGDIIYVDVTPYKYKEVFYQEELVDGKNIFDFTGVFDKPFDIRYYDVYLNGRKLSLNNIINISPWKISLTNLKSKYHFQIFERERDYEYFGTDFKSNKYFYTVDDLLNAGFISDTDKDALITNIINNNKDKNLTLNSNINDEEKLDFEPQPYEYISRYLFYSNHLLPLKLVNPDQLQLNKYEIEVSYPTVHEKYYTNSKYEHVIMLDPDIYMEGLDNTKDEQLVYTLGHLGDVDNSILDTE